MRPPPPGPGAATAADGLLRPALQLALDVARVGARSSPPADTPRTVRPFLHLTGRLPDAGLVAVRRGLDEDEDFRARVAGLADEDELGRAGWLFVVRPDGWEGELATLSAEADARSRAEQEERDERSFRRRVIHAEEATQRAEAAAARSRAELAAANAELAAERRERRASQDGAAQLARRVSSLEGERDSARRRAGDSSAEAGRLLAEVAGLRTELGQVRAAGEALRAEAEAEALRFRAERLRAEAAGGTGGPGGRTGGARAGGADAGTPGAAPRAGLSPAGRIDGAGSAGSAGSGGSDLAAAASAVAAAAAAASALGRALDQASAALAPPRSSAGAVVPAGGAAGGSPPTRVRTPGPTAVRRLPADLPPALRDDTTEAAAHLVRVPDVLVLVDGYNAAKGLWPHAAPPELRERLVDALSELVARTGASVHVVYDGADLGLPHARPVSRRGVRVSFSPAGVEADDVILDLVGEVPPGRPVVVASSDKRVQDGAHQRGANVISSAQLAGILGRS